MTKIEEVARAIHTAMEASDPGCFSTHFEIGSDDGKPIKVGFDGYFDLAAVARAAIEALREPSEEMIRAPAYRVNDKGEGLLSDGDTTNAVWHAMIDAILKEPT